MRRLSTTSRENFLQKINIDFNLELLLMLVLQTRFNAFYVILTLDLEKLLDLIVSKHALITKILELH